MAGVISIIVSILAVLFLAALRSYLLMAVVWGIGRVFTRGTMRFPGKAAIALTLLLAIFSVTSNADSWDARLRPSKFASQVEALHEIHTAALNGELSPSEVDLAISGLSLSRWPALVSEAAVVTLTLKSDRYMDLLQSLYRGTVVRTPLAPVAASMYDALMVADAKWTPLLASAARGDQVVFSEEFVAGPVELMMLSLGAAYAKIEVLTSIERHHGISVPLSASDRDLGQALRWLPAFYQATEVESGAAQLERLRANADLLLNSGIPIWLLDEVIESSQAELGEAAASYFVSTFERIRSDLEASISLMTKALGGDPNTNWTQLNSRRRIAALPIVVPDTDIPEIERSGRLSWVVDYEGMTVSSLELDRLNSKLEELDERWAYIREKL